MRFVKVHGLGNDFVLVESSDPAFPPPDFVGWVCDRRRGVGADGLLVLAPHRDDVQQLRIWNADGNEAETCGNGLRCVAKYVRERGYVTTDQFIIATPFRTHPVTCRREGDVVRGVTVGMGIPCWGELVGASVGKPMVPGRVVFPSTLEIGDRRDPGRHPKEGPGNRPGGKEGPGNRPGDVEGPGYSGALVSVSGYSVTLGNPHFVIVQDSASPAGWPASLRDEGDWFLRHGKALAEHRAFRAGSNVEFVTLEGARRLRMVVYERGVGLTAACGSGASAGAALAIALGRVESPVEVELPGGCLTIEWDGTGEVRMTGPAAEVFSGELPLQVPAGGG